LLCPRIKFKLEESSQRKVKREEKRESSLAAGCSSINCEKRKKYASRRQLFRLEIAFVFALALFLFLFLLWPIHKPPHLLS